MTSPRPTPRVVAIVQARLGSRRLPGKVLADLCGKPILAWVVDRARRAERLDDVVVATTTDEQDNAIQQCCLSRGFRFTRGHPTDVLQRFRSAAEEARADVIVRLTADCPFLDPALVQEAVNVFLASEPPVSLVLNRVPWQRSFPIGLDVEVFSWTALESADREARLPHEREHVTPFLYERPMRFPLIQLQSGGPWGMHRWTVDEEADLRFVREVCARFSGRDDFSWREILRLVESEPGLADINRGVRHKGQGEAEGLPERREG